MGEKIWFIPAFLIALGILLLSTVFAIQFPMAEEVRFIDKWEHGFAYFALVTSFLFAFKKTDSLSNRISRRILIGSGCYGLVLEFAQATFFPARFFEWYDALANVLGALIGFGAFHLIFRKTDG